MNEFPKNLGIKDRLCLFCGDPALMSRSVIEYTITNYDFKGGKNVTERGARVIHTACRKNYF